MATERRFRAKRGQALMELAIGLFALALVVSALCGFAHYIVRSLRAQNALRESGRSNAKSDVVEVDAFAAEYVFGKAKMKISEKIELPSTLLTP